MDQQLIDTARDYFHFVTKFFEVIKLSATHIYHSALELSPKSSIVRETYHQQSIEDYKPRVIHGVPTSWSQPTTISGNYGSYTWLPCGQYFAAQTSTSVEIWDALTLERHSNLQLTQCQTATDVWDPHYHSPDTLAYSPDGHSLAGYFGSAITIWDMQTGGVVEEILCRAINTLPKLLVWSLDGTMICAVFPAGVGTWTVVTYDITSGNEASISAIPSLTKPWLWPHSNTLQAMTILGDEVSHAIINISEICPTNGLNESFSIKLNLCDKCPTISFSPSTYRISITIHEYSDLYTLFIFNIWDSKILLQDMGCFTANCLSPDGSLLVASGAYDVYIWKYTTEQDYVLWRKFPFWSVSDDVPQGYQFSPASSSMLVSRVGSLEIQHLEGLASGCPVKAICHYDEFSTDGAYLVTAHEFGLSVTITNLHKNTSQCIFTEFEIHGLALTGNTLLVQGICKLVGWRLTADGTVDKIFDDRREGYENILWTKMVHWSRSPQFGVEGNIGVVDTSGGLFCYNIETGEELQSVLFEAPPLSSPFWRNFNNHTFHSKTHYSFSYHNFAKGNDSSEGDLTVSVPWYEEGWVKYPEGEHRYQFWLPTHWRPGWNEAHWLDGVTTLRLVTPSGLIILIKF